MSIPWLTVFALLIGISIYRVFYTLVKSVRLIAACVFMVAFIVIVQNLETIGHLWNSPGTLHGPILSEKRARNFSNPNEQPGPITDIAFQSIIREDHNFLDEFTQKQSQTGRSPGSPTSIQVPDIGKNRIIGAGDESGLKAELAANTVQVRRAEPVPHKETVKRAQLVTQNETPKHAAPVRSGQR
jgi:hypothetical protein